MTLALPISIDSLLHRCTFWVRLPVREDAGDGATDHVGAIQGEMSRARLQDALKLRDRRNFISTYLKPALDAGLVEMTLPNRPTSRHRRYRRTPAGEALARRLEESGK